MSEKNDVHFVKKGNESLTAVEDGLARACAGVTAFERMAEAEDPSNGRSASQIQRIRPIESDLVTTTHKGPMTKNDSVVAIYQTHRDAEYAVKELQRSGFDMKQLSIVGKEVHTEEHVVGYYNAGDRMKYWGGTGAVWGGFWGLLFGSAFFWVPGIGPLLMAGPLVASVVATLEGAVAVGGLSALGAGLYSLGIPKDTVLQYETAVKSDKFLVIAHGTTEELAKAKDIMHSGNLVAAN